MALSLAELVLLSLLVDWLFRKVRIPGLVGMLIIGIITGPFVLGFLKPSLSVGIIRLAHDCSNRNLAPSRLRAYQGYSTTRRPSGSSAVVYTGNI